MHSQLGSTHRRRAEIIYKPQCPGQTTIKVLDPTPLDSVRISRRTTACRRLCQLDCQLTGNTSQMRRPSRPNKATEIGRRTVGAGHSNELKLICQSEWSGVVWQWSVVPHDSEPTAPGIVVRSANEKTSKRKDMDWPKETKYYAWLPNAVIGQWCDRDLNRVLIDGMPLN